MLAAALYATAAAAAAAAAALEEEFRPDWPIEAQFIDWPIGKTEEFEEDLVVLSTKAPHVFPVLEATAAAAVVADE